MKSSVSYTAVYYASVSNMVLKTWFQWLLLASLLLSDIALGKNTKDRHTVILEFYNIKD